MQLTTEYPNTEAQTGRPARKKYTNPQSYGTHHSVQELTDPAGRQSVKTQLSNAAPTNNLIYLTHRLFQLRIAEYTFL